MSNTITMNEVNSKPILDKLDETVYPYNVRGLYNQNKRTILRNGIHTEFIKHLSKLLDIHSGSSLDRDTIMDIIEDIEIDVESMKLNRFIAVRDAVKIKKVEEEKTQMEKCRTLMQDEEDKDGLVVVIFNAEKNILKRVEREAFRQVLNIAKTKEQAAKMLGISIRGLTNKLEKYNSESQQSLSKQSN